MGIGNVSTIEMVARLTRAVGEAPRLVSSVLYQIPEYKDKTPPEYYETPAIHTHVQSASSTACGWGGVAGQAFTDFWMTVIQYDQAGVAIIYVSRAAYICKIDEEYQKHLIGQDFPLWDRVSQSKLSVLWKAK